MATALELYDSLAKAGHADLGQLVYNLALAQTFKGMAAEYGPSQWETQQHAAAVALARAAFEEVLAAAAL